MALLRLVDFWPATGFPASAWAEDPDVDAFVKSARRICERYSEGLAAQEIARPPSGSSPNSTPPDPMCWWMST